MNSRFRLFRRSNGTFYSEDISTGRQVSLRTKNRTDANRLIYARDHGWGFLK